MHITGAMVVIERTDVIYHTEASGHRREPRESWSTNVHVLDHQQYSSMTAFGGVFYCS